MKQLNAAIKDEKYAPKEYHKLLHELTRKEDKEIIHKIIKDERRHEKKLEEIKHRVKKHGY